MGVKGRICFHVVFGAADEGVSFRSPNRRYLTSLSLEVMFVDSDYWIES